MTSIAEFTPSLPEKPEKKTQDAATKISKTYRGHKVRKEFSKNLALAILELHEQYVKSYRTITNRYPNRSELIQDLLFQTDMKELQPLREKIIKLSNLYLSSHSSASISKQSKQSIDFESLYKMSKKEIVETARNYLYKVGKIKLIEFQVNENEKNSPDVLKSMLNKYQGISIGESHDGMVENFIINNLQYLHKLGVRTIFVEGLDVSLQATIDFYFQNGNIEPLQKKLDINENPMKAHIIENMIKLLIKGRELGIKVYGLDCKASEFGFTTDRLIAANFLSSKIIEKHKGAEQYLAVVGAAHLTNLYHGVIPGLAELTGTPAVYFFRSKKEYDDFQNQVGGEFSNQITAPHTTIYMHRAPSE